MPEHDWILLNVPIPENAWINCCHGSEYAAM